MISAQVVAVKSFNAQASQTLSEDALAERFAREINNFYKLGLGPGADNSKSTANLLVNLLDYSRDEVTKQPCRHVDGQFYSVFELAQESLSEWLSKLKHDSQTVGFQSFCKIAATLGGALSWLHVNNLCHLDVKPENVMLFGKTWKLIDLDGCLAMNGSTVVTSDSITPLYASPEVARTALGDGIRLSPCGTMDTWAAGVVLLDVCAGGTAFQETKSGFDSASLFEEEAVPFEGWYTWVCDPSSIRIEDFADVSVLSPSSEASCDDIKSLINGLLNKDPSARFSSEMFRQHSLIQSYDLGSPNEMKANEEAASPTLKKRSGLPFCCRKLASLLRP
jgi:serine/threonine protein kinase